MPFVGVAQRQEAIVLGTIQCQFESDLEYHKYAELAQQEEQVPYKYKVRGSSPLFCTSRERLSSLYFTPRVTP